MYKIISAVMLLTVINICSALPHAHDDASLAPMLEKAIPAVVNISVRGELPAIPFAMLPHQEQDQENNQNAPSVNPQMPQIPPKFAGVGSGVIVDAKHGFILTNAHLIKNVKIITVTLNDHRKFQGKLLGTDEKTDIAVIKINAKHLTAIEFADSNQLKVGDFVVAIGNPFGLGQSVTSGMVSALERSALGIESYENFIQTDAPINPGNSGGPLVNMQGKLVGINTAIISPPTVGANIGIGFAIPSNMAQKIKDQIIHYGEVEHSVLGIIVQNITPALADTMHLPDTKGAIISDVDSSTPAEHAGLKPKDVILEVNDEPVQNGFQVSTEIGLLRPGSNVKLKLRRNGTLKTMHLTTLGLHEAQEALKHAEKPLLSGLALRDTNQLIDNQQVVGVQIIGVDPFSYAFGCGMVPGDVILEAGGKPITNINQLKEIAQKNPDRLLLKVKHIDQNNIFLVLEK